MEMLFSNSLIIIIHQVITKEIITVTEVWIPGHRFLRFYLSVNALGFVAIEKIDQTLETLFHIIYKGLEFRQKYSVTRRIFNSLLSVWKSDETLSLVFDILPEDCTIMLLLFGC